MDLTLDFIERLLSGSLPFVLTVSVGGYFTFKTRFYQFRKFYSAMQVIKPQKGQGKAPFFAMCSSLSSAIGTGNIVGVAAAISLGGAGAVFWMWISAILGMVIKSGEIALGISYRQKKDDKFVGGPMYYIKNALPKGFGILSWVFAFLGVFASFFCGNITQINSAVSSVSENIFVRFLFGLSAAFITFFVIFGGVQKIGNFLCRVLPFMAILYTLLCLGVIIVNFGALDEAFYKIFVGAFNPKAVSGGCIGRVINVISVGASKGIFSNESGLGTAAVAHAGVQNTTPQKESLFGIFEVFVDTIFICTLTALTILTSGVIIDYGTVSDTPLTLNAISTVYGGFSSFVLNLMLLLFGISSVIGWGLYGISFCNFLFGKTGVKLYVFIYPLFCIIGALSSVDTVWRLSELFNGVMVIINLFAMIFLSKDVINILKDDLNDKAKNR